MSVCGCIHACDEETHTALLNSRALEPGNPVFLDLAAKRPSTIASPKSFPFSMSKH